MHQSNSARFSQLAMDQKPQTSGEPTSQQENPWNREKPPHNQPERQQTKQINWRNREPQPQDSQQQQLQGAWRKNENKPKKSVPQIQEASKQRPQQEQKSSQSQKQAKPSTSGKQKQAQLEPLSQKSAQSKEITTMMTHLICPHKGYGTKGRKIGNIEVNYLKLDISGMIDVAFHYDVDIVPNSTKKNWSGVFSKFCNANFPGVEIPFDGKKNAYAPKRLDLTDLQREVQFIDPEGNSGAYIVSIKEAHDTAISLSSLHK